jgi:hypothetical protein
VLSFVVIGETAALVVAVVIYVLQMRTHVVVTVSSSSADLAACPSLNIALVVAVVVYVLQMRTYVVVTVSSSSADLAACPSLNAYIYIYCEKPGSGYPTIQPT